MVLDHLPSLSRVDFDTDISKETSIKFLGRKQRRTSKVCFISDPKTLAPMDWKGSMANDVSKKSELKFLIEQW